MCTVLILDSYNGQFLFEAPVMVLFVAFNKYMWYFLDVLSCQERPFFK